MTRLAWLLLGFVLGVAALCVGGELAAADIPRDPAAAHSYADTVLYPRFVAAINDWAHQHPRDPEGREGEHCDRMDAGDVGRWRLVREAFRDLDQAYKRAGY